MGLFESEFSKLQDMLSEEYLYGSVPGELTNNHLRPVLCAKAFAQAYGNKNIGTGHLHQR